MDTYTKDLFDSLTDPSPEDKVPSDDIRQHAETLYNSALENRLTAPVIALFSFLLEQKTRHQLPACSLRS